MWTPKKIINIPVFKKILYDRLIPFLYGFRFPKKREPTNPTLSPIPAKGERRAGRCGTVHRTWLGVPIWRLPLEGGQNELERV